ncbi:unnamed protein product [Amoebophrya sp. A120]|nr:unnamed protein product [Amoebophrya sp. A120]|eukprot:GSA120T00000344001.1
MIDAPGAAAPAPVDRHPEEAPAPPLKYRLVQLWQTFVGFFVDSDYKNAAAARDNYHYSSDGYRNADLGAEENLFYYDQSDKCWKKQGETEEQRHHRHVEALQRSGLTSAQIEANMQFVGPQAQLPAYNAAVAAAYVPPPPPDKRTAAEKEAFARNINEEKNAHWSYTDWTTGLEVQLGGGSKNHAGTGGGSGALIPKTLAELNVERGLNQRAQDVAYGPNTVPFVVPPTTAEPATTSLPVHPTFGATTTTGAPYGAPSGGGPRGAAPGGLSVSSFEGASNYYTTSAANAITPGHTESCSSPAAHVAKARGVTTPRRGRAGGTGQAAVREDGGGGPQQHAARPKPSPVVATTNPFG